MKLFPKNVMRMRLWYDDEGQDLVEYALLAGLLGVAAALFAPQLSTSMGSIYSKLASKLTESASI